MSTTKEECQREYDIAQKRACDAEAENARLRDALKQIVEVQPCGYPTTQAIMHNIAQEALKEI